MLSSGGALYIHTSYSYHIHAQLHVGDHRKGFRKGTTCDDFSEQTRPAAGCREGKATQG